MSAKSIAKVLLQRVGLEVHRRRDLQQLAVHDEHAGPFYNIGAGSFWHPRWTNIDYVSDWYSGVQRDVIHHDLMSGDPLPIDDASAEIIYTEHTVEHVSEEAVARLFREAHRALRPGGIFRVATGPDAETDWRAMRAGDARWFYWDDELYSKPGTFEAIYRAPANSVPIEERWLHHVASALAPNDLSTGPKVDAAEIRRLIDERGFEDTLDHLTSLVRFDPERPGNHISWWSGPKLLRFLEDAGFAAPYRSGHGQSTHPILRGPMFDQTHPQITVYVEARR